MYTVVIKDYNFDFALQVLQSGGLVGVPTETVYGLAANAFNPIAVAMIYELKGRPSSKPLSLLVSGTDMAQSVCARFPEAAHKLANAFWPGPLTIVLPRNDAVPPIVTSGGDTVGVRCPRHTKTLEFLRVAGVPLAAPSANISGKPSPKTVDDVLGYFDGRLACIIDGGECTLGSESTVVSLPEAPSAEDEPYKILRQGVLPEEELYKALNS